MTRKELEQLRVLLRSPNCPATLPMPKEDVQSLLNKIDTQTETISRMGWQLNPDRMGS